jgi:hypothetical protein
MAQDFQSDFQDFQRFVDLQLDGETALSLEQALDAFRAYQRDRQSFQNDTRRSLEESARGQSSPLDIDDFLKRGKDRLARKGVTD